MSYSPAQIRAFVMDQLIRMGEQTDGQLLAAARGFGIDPLELVREIDALIASHWIAELVAASGSAYEATQAGEDCRGMLPPFIPGVEPVAKPWAERAPGSISSAALEEILRKRKKEGKCE